MTEKNSNGALGRGLGNLVSEAASAQTPVAAAQHDHQRGYRMLPTSQIDADWIGSAPTDKTYDEELKASIRAEGVLQPIVVQRTPSGYRLLAGRRRLQAARELEMGSVPSIVMSIDDNKAAQIATAAQLTHPPLFAKPASSSALEPTETAPTPAEASPPPSAEPHEHALGNTVGTNDKTVSCDGRRYWIAAAVLAALLAGDIAVRLRPPAPPPPSDASPGPGPLLADASTATVAAVTGAPPPLDEHPLTSGIASSGNPLDTTTNAMDTSVAMTGQTGGNHVETPSHTDTSTSTPPTTVAQALKQFEPDGIEVTTNSRITSIVFDGNAFGETNRINWTATSQLLALAHTLGPYSEEIVLRITGYAGSSSEPGTNTHAEPSGVGLARARAVADIFESETPLPRKRILTVASGDDTPHKSVAIAIRTRRRR